MNLFLVTSCAQFLDALFGFGPLKELLGSLTGVNTCQRGIIVFSLSRLCSLWVRVCVYPCVLEKYLVNPEPS